MAGRDGVVCDVPVVRAGNLSALPGVVHGFFGRGGGVSQGCFAALNVSTVVGDDAAAVETNWQRVRERLAVPLRFARMQQVHGAFVAIVDRQNTAVGEADAMVTDCAAVALTVLTADCVPVLIAAPSASVVGVAHAGWKGTLAGVAVATVEVMRSRYAVAPSDLRIALGPSINGCCYEVDDQLAARFAALGADVEAAIVRGVSGKPRLDLRRVNRVLLERIGIAGEQIEVAGPCTACAAGEFFSHRAHAGRTGRQVSVLARRE